MVIGCIITATTITVIFSCYPRHQNCGKMKADHRESGMNISNTERPFPCSLHSRSGHKHIILQGKCGSGRGPGKSSSPLLSLSVMLTLENGSEPTDFLNLTMGYGIFGFKHYAVINTHIFRLTVVHS